MYTYIHALKLNYIRTCTFLVTVYTHVYTAGLLCICQTMVMDVCIILYVGADYIRGTVEVLLHFSMTMHLPVPEFTNVLLTNVLVGEPVHLTVPMEMTVFETTFVESSSRLLSEFTTEGGGGGWERERERERGREKEREREGERERERERERETEEKERERKRERGSYHWYTSLKIHPIFNCTRTITLCTCHAVEHSSIDLCTILL